MKIGDRVRYYSADNMSNLRGTIENVFNFKDNLIYTVKWDNHFLANYAKENLRVLKFKKNKHHPYTNIFK